MSSMNVVLLVGFINAAPTLQTFTRSSKCELQVALPKAQPSKLGQTHDVLSVTFWNETAMKVVDTFHTGQWVQIKASINRDDYKKRDGEIRQGFMDINGTHIAPMSGIPDAQPVRTPGMPPSDAGGQAYPGGGGDSTIPF